VRLGCCESEDGLTRLRLVPTCYFEPEQNAFISGAVNNVTSTKLFEFEVQFLRLQVTVTNRQHSVPGVIHHRSVPVPAYAQCAFASLNPQSKRALMELRATLPPELEQRGWRVTFRGLPEVLPSGGKADVTIELTKGHDFTAADVKQMRDPSLTVQTIYRKIG